jgi:hypothetical protein
MKRLLVVALVTMFASIISVAQICDHSSNPVTYLVRCPCGGAETFRTVCRGAPSGSCDATHTTKECFAGCTQFEAGRCTSSAPEAAASSMVESKDATLLEHSSVCATSPGVSLDRWLKSNDKLPGKDSGNPKQRTTGL